MEVVDIGVNNIRSIKVCHGLPNDFHTIVVRYQVWTVTA